jgi:hypothetical protein
MLDATVVGWDVAVADSLVAPEGHGLLSLRYSADGIVLWVAAASVKYASVNLPGGGCDGDGSDGDGSGGDDGGGSGCMAHGAASIFDDQPQLPNERANVTRPAGQVPLMRWRVLHHTDSDVLHFGDSLTRLAGASNCLQGTVAPHRLAVLKARLSEEQMDITSRSMDKLVILLSGVSLL